MEDPKQRVRGVLPGDCRKNIPEQSVRFGNLLPWDSLRQKNGLLIKH